LTRLHNAQPDDRRQLNRHERNEAERQTGIDEGGDGQPAEARLPQQGERMQ
jgi:hypothetical protein